MTQSQIELLTYLSGLDEGSTSSDVAEEFDITEATANKRLSVLRKHDLAKRSRNSENQYAHIITDNGLKALEQVSDNPLKREVKIMAKPAMDDREDITYTLPADLLDTIDEIAEDENRDVNDVVEELLGAGLDALYNEDDEPQVVENQQ